MRYRNVITRHVLFLCFALSFAVPAAAQSDTDVEDDRANDIVELLTLMDLETQHGHAIGSMLSISGEPLAQMLEGVQAFIEEYLSWETIRPELVKIYASMFTREEVRDLIAFYQSPTGAKLVSRTPEINRISIAMTQRIINANRPEFERMLRGAMGAPTEGW